MNHGPYQCRVGAGFVRIHNNLNDFKEAYLDEYTREVLPHQLVMDATKDELE